MDELWKLYLEQQAAKKAAADGAVVLSPEPNTSGAPNPTLTCDEPTGE